MLEEWLSNYSSNLKVQGDSFKLLSKELLSNVKECVDHDGGLTNWKCYLVTGGNSLRIA